MCSDILTLNVSFLSILVSTATANTDSSIHNRRSSSEESLQSKVRDVLLSRAEAAFERLIAWGFRAGCFTIANVMGVAASLERAGKLGEDATVKSLSNSTSRLRATTVVRDILNRSTLLRTFAGSGLAARKFGSLLSRGKGSCSKLLSYINSKISCLLIISQGVKTENERKEK